MKTRSAILQLLVTACLLATATVAFGQTTYIWTGAGDGTNLVNTNNWSPQGLPSGATQDTAEWNGLTTGNLLLDYNGGGWPSTGFGSLGVVFYITGSQANSVQVYSLVPSSATVGIFEINLDPGAGAFTLGDNTANLLQVAARPAGAVHPFINNSTTLATIDPSVRWIAGGGNGYTYDFQGTGTWIVNSYLRPDNGAFSPTFVELDGSVTVFWNGGGAIGNSGLGTVTINGGTLILGTNGLLSSQSIGNNATFVFNAASQSQTLSGAISGPGSLVVSNGALTLSGQNTYSGSNILVGGELIAGAAESPGVSGPLGEFNTNSFLGGTLGFSVNNVFDYSSNFDTGPNQQYSIDTRGQNVTFWTGLGSVGGTMTKLGAGTLTLAGASSYTGLTTVNVGKLVFEASKSGTGNITVADGASLGVFDTGTQVTPGSLTLGSSSGSTLEFNGVSSTSTPLIAAGTLSSAGTLTININSGTLTVGQSYPLLSWTTGTAPTVNLGILNGFIGNLSFSGNTLMLNVTATAYKWSGANNNSWDLSTTGNWIQNGGPVVFANGGPAIFDDSTTVTNVTVSAPVQPTLVTFDNNNNPYSVASSGANNIGGSAALLMAGSGTLTLSGGANSYTGVTTLSAGTVSVGALANGGSPSDLGAAPNVASNLVLNGGTLQYTGSGASIDRLFTLTTSGGTIEAEGTGALTLNNTGSLGYLGNSARILTLDGNDTSTGGDTLASVVGDNGGATSLTKNGTGTWILTGNNTYSGGTTIAAGELEVGAGGGTGALGSGPVVNNGSLDINRTNTLTISGIISGTGPVTNDGSGTLVLPANNSYTGGTFINAGTVQVGTGGSTGSLDINSSITNNGTLIYDSTGAYTLNGNIGGTGQVVKEGSGLLILQGTESYSGNTTISSGGALEIFKGNQGVFATGGNITDNGTLYLVRQDNSVAGITNAIVGSGKLIEDVNNPNPGDVTLVGTNSYTGGTFIAGGGIVLGDGVTAGAGAITGNVMFTNPILTANDTFRSLTFNRADNFTFSGSITGLGGTTSGGVAGNAGRVIQMGTNTVTLTANNSYLGGTTISNGTLVVGAGGFTGTIGSGAVIVSAVTGPATLAFNRVDNNLIVPGAFSGSNGVVVQEGSGELTLSGNNTNFNGPMIVSNGTLVVNSTGGDVDVAGGELVAGGLNTVGTLLVGSNLNISAGVVAMTLNKASAQPNSYVLVTNIYNDTNSPVTNGVISYTGGTLKLLNFGPALTAGDTFVLFSEPVTGGATMPIVAPGTGATFVNNLAVNGSVTVAAVAPPGPQQITASRSGSQLVLSWPSSWTGAHLQAQTNSLTGTNWVNIPGSDLNNSYTNTIAPGVKDVFFRTVLE